MEPTRIIAPGAVTKSSIFESCWIGESEGERGSRAGEWGKEAAGQKDCATGRRLESSKLGESPIESAANCV
jgi:hypothetical protein